MKNFIFCAVLNKIQKEFIWRNGSSKLKHTLCNDHEKGGLMVVIFFFKVISLQCLWVKRLHDGNFLYFGN